MPSLQIRLLGRFQVELDNRPVTTLEHQRLQHLLAYLVLYRSSPRPRSRVATTFWPEASDAQALTNLRNLIYRLRSALPDADIYMLANSHQVGWRATGCCDLDVASFEAYLTTAATAGDVASRAEALAAAVQCYQGDFLPDCYDDWAIEARERLRHNYHGALLQLTQLLEAQCEYLGAIQHARQLLRDEPLQEAYYRLLMRLYALSGDRAGIARTYQACIEVLRQELAVEPAQETLLLYWQLWRAGERPEPPLARVAMRSVGRETAQQELQCLWRQTERGQAHMALITGEPGIGKTQLARDVLEWATRQGVPCAEASCYAAEGALPFAAATTWLRSAPIQATMRALDVRSRLEVARLCPDLLALEDEHAQLTIAPEPLQRQRFFAALAQALLAGEQPRMLLLDDVHWCDRETAEWLHYLLRSRPAAPLFLVATARSDELTTDRPLHTLMSSLRRLDQLTVVELSRLDQNATEELAATLIGRRLPSEIGKVVYGATEGVPLFIVELLRAGLHDHCLGSTPGSCGAELPELPAQLVEHLTDRLALVSPMAVTVATIVALCDQPLSFETLARALELNEEALLMALDELLFRRILREQGDDVIALGHRAFRAPLLARLSRVRRRVLERRLASAGKAEYLIVRRA